MNAMTYISSRNGSRRFSALRVAVVVAAVYCSRPWATTVSRGLLGAGIGPSFGDEVSGVPPADGGWATVLDRVAPAAPAGRGRLAAGVLRRYCGGGRFRAARRSESAKPDIQY